MFSRYQAINGAFERSIDDKKDNDMTECELTEILGEQNKLEVEWHYFASLDSYSGVLLGENENLESGEAMYSQEQSEPTLVKKLKGLILMNLEVKDALYYSDLMYELRSLAGFEQDKDEATEERIIERSKSIVEEQETGPFRYLNKLSVFQQELFEIVSDISKKAGVTFTSLSAISKYPELVKEILIELEEKRKETLWEPIIKEHPESGLNNKQTYGDSTHYGFVEPQEDSEKYEYKGLYPSSKSTQQGKLRLVKKLTPPKNN